MVVYCLCLVQLVGSLAQILLGEREREKKNLTFQYSGRFSSHSTLTHFYRLPMEGPGSSCKHVSAIHNLFFLVSRGTHRVSFPVLRQPPVASADICLSGTISEPGPDEETVCDAAPGIRNLTSHPGKWVGGCWEVGASAASSSSSSAKLKHGGFGGITAKTIEGKDRTHAAYHHSGGRV